jgi:hypothetical protein
MDTVRFACLHVTVEMADLRKLCFWGIVMRMHCFHCLMAGVDRRLKTSTYANVLWQMLLTRPRHTVLSNTKHSTNGSQLDDVVWKKWTMLLKQTASNTFARISYCATDYAMELLPIASLPLTASMRAVWIP